jgi:hypothetical protein
MKEFRTIVRVSAPAHRIALKHRILTMGSCFSDAIGSHLAFNKFKTSINPFGILYNPISIHRILVDSISNNDLPENSYLQHDEVFLNYHFHSSFSALQKGILEKKIFDAISETKTFLQKCNWLLITYGTAWVYKSKESGEIVANCHKRPSKLFEKSLLTIAEITESFERMSKELEKTNPGLRIILTVSPVRHVKDSLELNNVSKSILRTACHYLAEKFSHVEYFPAYEIMMDDLRDYRFYKADMIHPSEQAEDYIWDKFFEQYMDEASQDFIRRWRTIYPALMHRPFHPASSGHQIFLRQTLHKLEELRSIVNVDAEINSVQSQLLIFNSNQTST